MKRQIPATARRRFVLRLARRVTMAKFSTCLAVVGTVVAVLAGLPAEKCLLVLAAGLSGAVLTRLPDLVELGAWGFKARLDRAEEVAKRAEVTLAELRRVALPLAHLSVANNIHALRFEAYDEGHALTQVEALLEAIDATAVQRHEILGPIRARKHLEEASTVGDLIRQAVRDRAAAGEADPEEIRRLSSCMIDAKRWAAAPPSAWRELAARHNALTPQVLEAIGRLEVAAAADPRPGKHVGLPRTLAGDAS